MKSVFRYAGGFAGIGMVWAIAEFQSVTTAIVLLAFWSMMSIMLTEDRLTRHSELLGQHDDALEGLRAFSVADDDDY